MDPAPVLGAEGIIELGERLRAAGISAAPDQITAAIDVAYRLQLSEREDARRKLADYRAFLAPVFCRSQEDQELFHDLYLAWAREKEAAQQSTGTGAAVEPGPSPKPPPAKVPWVGLLILAIIVGYFIFGTDDTTTTTAPGTSPPAGKTDSRGGEVTPPVSRPTPAAADLYAAAVPRPPEQIKASIVLAGGLELTTERVRESAMGWVILLFLGWLLWKLGRRRILLERHPADGSDTPKLHAVKVKGTDAQLFTRQHLRPTIDRLRTPVRTVTPNVDMPRTIEATLRANGLFTPVYRKRRRLPEYVVLIDRSHPRDHLAAFAFEMIERLRRENLSVYAYYFYGDPRRCQVFDARYATVHLDEIEAQHGGARLLLLSDCAGLFSPFSGKPERWLTQLERWPERVVMTPQPSQTWGYTELSLCIGGFIVAPLTSEGLSLVAEHFAARTVDGENQVDGGRLISSSQGESILPRIIELHFDEWVERQEPTGADLEVLFAALRRYLGKDGMRVLAASAVYPEVSWPLLMFLAMRLAPEGDTATAREQRLFNLARLPWFRHAHIPDYLRVRLIRTLSESETQEVRDLFRSLFDSALAEGTKSLELTIAEPPTEKRWREIARQWFTSRSDETREVDYIYPKVVMSGQPGLLDFELPQQLMRLFPGARWHRMTAAVVGALAITALLATAAWFGFGLAAPVVERYLATIERERNANFPIRIWHPEEQEATAQAIALTLQQRGFPVTRRVVENSQGGLFNTPVVVYGQAEGKRTAEWVAARASYATYLQKSTLFTWDEGAQRSQAELGMPNQADFITAGQPEPGARIILARRLSRIPTDPVGTPVSFQDRFAKGSLAPVVTVIPAGTILLGSTSEPSGYEGPTPLIDIPQGFAISQREVTVDEFARFVAETGYRTDAEKEGGLGCSFAGNADNSETRRTSWRSPRFEQTGSHPVVCVSWNDARAYIEWLTDRTGEAYRLPSEAEWEYAARDTADISRHPWENIGQACAFANVGDNGSTLPTEGPYPCDDGARNTAPVASYPASRVGLYDMLGNASEWVQDCWEGRHENVPKDGRAYEVEPCTARTIRGMDWQTFADKVDFVNRRELAPTASGNTIGFRVVRQLTQPVRRATAN